jgi:N-terminal domain of Peptidase_S41 in eukaryotic IRBP
MSTPRLVEDLIARLDAGYIFPERAERAAALLRERLEDGAYVEVFGPELCKQISADLFAASDDKHLRLIWHEAPTAAPDQERLHAELREQVRLENHGVRRVELLPDSVGLIELTIIPEASTGGATLAAAMLLMQNTAALILDLRVTRGGSPDELRFSLATSLPTVRSISATSQRGLTAVPASTGPPRTFPDRVTTIVRSMS